MAEGKSKHRAAREASAHPMLERLKPGEAAAILRRLLTHQGLALRPGR